MPLKITKENSLRILAYTTVVLLLSGFLWNRVANNIGLLLAGVHTVIYLHSSWKELKGPVLYALLGIILYPTIHDLLFHGMDFLHAQNTMKWSLIVYPLFFVGCLRYPHFLKHVSILFIISLFIASCYSLSEYMIHFDRVNQEYGKAKVMKVLAYSDHIRLSWATVVSIVLAFYYMVRSSHRGVRLILGAYIVFQFVYLHILGSKNGLLTLYLTILILVVGFIFQKNKVTALVVLLALIISPIIAYKTIPSFQNRVEYIQYEYSMYSKKEYQAGLSDALRLYSIRGGMELVQQHFFLGVGYAKVQEKMDQWYLRNTPFLSKDNYFLPISQFLLYWVTGGILACLLLIYFVYIVLYHFRKNAIFLGYFIPVTLSFVYENHLETQTGVFLFGFTFGLFLILGREEQKIRLN